MVSGNIEHLLSVRISISFRLLRPLRSVSNLPWATIQVIQGIPGPYQVYYLKTESIYVSISAHQSIFSCLDLHRNIIYIYNTVIIRNDSVNTWIRTIRIAFTQLLRCLFRCRCRVSRSSRRLRCCRCLRCWRFFGSWSCICGVSCPANMGIVRQQVGY